MLSLWFFSFRTSPFLHSLPRTVRTVERDICLVFRMEVKTSLPVRDPLSHNKFSISSSRWPSILPYNSFEIMLIFSHLSNGTCLHDTSTYSKKSIPDFAAIFLLN